MSSPSPAAKDVSQLENQRAGEPAAEATDAHSAQALALAAEIEAALAAGRASLLAPEALQTLMGALCKAYAADIENGDSYPALPERGATATDVMVVASALLRAADLQVFELGMWQSWTGR
jgi:hypothetical protein